jgi:predicted nucleotidyltransferase component of viral defense system
MISKDTVEVYASKYQTREENVLREYFQHLFLSTFYQQPGMDKVHFKGGTALRLIYNSPRFSEDLDFESPLTDIHRIENAIVATLSEIQKGGIDTELDEAKETSGGYLSTMKFSALGYEVPIRIEISFRDRKSKGETAIITSDLFPDYSLTQLSETQMVAGKIHALLDRKKPRDFYDFYFLLRHNMLPEKGKGEIMQQAKGALEKSSIRLDSELKEFLPKSHHMMIKDFKKMLKREIGRYI